MKLDQLLLESEIETAALCGWRRDQYFARIFDLGIEWLDSLGSVDPDGARSLGESKVFWKWWRMHIRTRNMRFVRPAKKELAAGRTTQSLREFYHKVVEPDILGFRAFNLPYEIRKETVYR